MDKTQQIKHIASEILQFLAFYVLAKIFWGGENWYQDKVKEMLFFLILGIVYTVLGIVFYSFGAPLILNFTQKNTRYNTSLTNFSINGQKRTSEHERVVELKMTVERKYSIWGKFVSKLLRNIDLTIVVEGNDDGLNLILDDANSPQFFTQTPKGFEFKIGRYIDTILTNTSQCNVSKIFYYRICEDTINSGNGGEQFILPRIKESTLRVRIIRLITRINFQSHIVNYIKN